MSTSLLESTTTEVSVALEAEAAVLVELEAAEVDVDEVVGLGFAAFSASACALVFCPGLLNAQAASRILTA